MLELYQFELSPYSEKVRLILDFKGLEYRKQEVTPGIGQFEVFRLSGQRQVPVLKDGSEAIADSTAIAQYLDQKFPEPPLTLADPQQQALNVLLEDWADRSFAADVRTVLLGALGWDPSLREAALPNQVPGPLRNLVSAVPSEVFSVLGSGVGLSPETLRTARLNLEQGLQSLCQRLQNQPYLLGDRPVLADLAIAAHSLFLKFPTTAAIDIPSGLRGRGVPGLVDNPDYALFFEWRDRLYREFRRGAAVTPPSSGNGPTKISID